MCVRALPCSLGGACGLHGRQKPLGNGTETGVSGKTLFAGRNINFHLKKINFTFNLKMTVFPASY